MNAERASLALELLGIPVEIACDDPALAARLALCYSPSLRPEAGKGALAASLPARVAVTVA